VLNVPPPCLPFADLHVSSSVPRGVAAAYMNGTAEQPGIGGLPHRGKLQAVQLSPWQGPRPSWQPSSPALICSCRLNFASPLAAAAACRNSPHLARRAPVQGKLPVDPRTGGAQRGSRGLHGPKLPGHAPPGAHGGGGPRSTAARRRGHADGETGRRVSSVRLCMRACVCACVRASVHASVRLCICACMCVCASVSA
jgi:hypothetical protein